MNESTRTSLLAQFKDWQAKLAAGAVYDTRAKQEVVARKVPTFVSTKMLAADPLFESELKRALDEAVYRLENPELHEDNDRVFGTLTDTQPARTVAPAQHAAFVPPGTPVEDPRIAALEKQVADMLAAQAAKDEKLAEAEKLLATHAVAEETPGEADDKAATEATLAFLNMTPKQVASWLWTGKRPTPTAKEEKKDTKKH